MIRFAILTTLLWAIAWPAEAKPAWRVDVDGGFPVFTAVLSGAKAARLWAGQGGSLGVGGAAEGLFHQVCPMAALALPCQVALAGGGRAELTPNVGLGLHVSPGLSLAVRPGAGAPVVLLAEHRVASLSSLAGTTTIGAAFPAKGAPTWGYAGVTVSRRGAEIFSSLTMAF